MIDIIDALVVLLSQIAFFTLGWIFFIKQIFKDYQTHQKTVQIIFSFTFSLSCGMFELIIFEILDVLTSP